jgi:N-acetyl sugar amidotransferase
MNERIISDPKDLKRCKNCVMPETQESIVFDKDGVCSTCRQIEVKHNVDWNERDQKFRDLLSKYRGKKIYDCIVPFSGGKDSTFTVWKLVKDYNLKPLVVRFNHHLLRPQVLENSERTIKRLGVDFFDFRADWQLIKKMMRVSLERKGDILWYQHTGIFSFPMHVAIKFDIPLIIWGEPSAEYDSYHDYDEEEEMDEKSFNTYVNLGITAEDMLGFLNDSSVDMDKLWPYSYPKRADLVKIGYKSTFLGNYIPWDVKKHVEIISRELGWKGDMVEGVPPEYNYEKIEDMMQGVQDYLKFIKRGYGRMSHLASIDIRNGRLTRDEAMKMIEKWEGKRPASLDVLLNWLNMTEEEFYNIVTPLSISPWKHDPYKTQKSEELIDQNLWNKD